MPDPRLDQYSVDPTFMVPFNVPGGAAAADYDGRMFIAPFPCEVIEVREQHQVAGTGAGAVTLMLKKCPSGTAKASGADVLAEGFDLKAPADTPQVGSLHATLANRYLVENDSLGLVTTGTLTAVDGVTVQVFLRVR